MQLVARRRRWCFRARTPPSGRRSADRASPCRNRSTPSNMPDVRMNSFSALRFSSCSGKAVRARSCCRAPDTTVAPMTRTAGHFARRSARRPPSSPVDDLVGRGVAVLAEIVDAFEPDHGSIRRTARSTSRSSRWPERGAAGERLCRDRIRPGPRPGCRRCRRSPPRPCCRRAACRRRDSTSGQRSSPFIVEAVPSVIESPNATIAKALGRRHHVDRVEEEPRGRRCRGMPPRPRPRPSAPAPGAVT